MLDLELDKITAFGFFNINSNLIVSVSVYIINYLQDNEKFKLIRHQV